MKIAVSIEPRDAVTLHAWAEAALRLPDITDLQRATVREALRRFNTAFNEAARPLAVASLTHPDAQVATAACSARTASKTIVGRSRRRRSGTVAA
jgi:hypothetical protein